MASWMDEYLAALQARDETEKAHLEFYQAYTRMADKSAQLAAAVALPAPSVVEVRTSIPPPVAGRRVTDGSISSAGMEAQLRSDLSKAQQERSELQSRLDRIIKEHEKLKSRSKVDRQRITQMNSEISHLSTRIKDRDEESRGKAKLLDDVQGEVVTLNLQLNMADEEMKKLRKENQELVDRWMRLKGKEAEKMNSDSKF